METYPAVCNLPRGSVHLQVTQGTELWQQVRELGGAENFRGQGVVLRDVLTAVSMEGWWLGGGSKARIFFVETRSH